MSDTLELLRRRIAAAGELKTVVRTMKVLAAASITQYEKAVQSLDDYYHAVELGLAAILRSQEARGELLARDARRRKARPGVVVFGSDQGLVGRFNEAMAEFVVQWRRDGAREVRCWVVGERIQGLLADAGFSVEGALAVPGSVWEITGLVGHVLEECDRALQSGEVTEIHVFHQCPRAGALYEPAGQRLLPLDDEWEGALTRHPWPTKRRPDIVGGRDRTLPLLVREYLFVVLFRACAESLASENASRLAAMQRAERNIDELLEHLAGDFRGLRQGSIDAELFEVISGFDAVMQDLQRRRG